MRPVSLALCAEEHLLPGCGGRKLKRRLEIRHAWAVEPLEGLSPSPFRVLLGKLMGGGEEAASGLCSLLPSPKILSAHP